MTVSPGVHHSGTCALRVVYALLTHINHHGIGLNRLQEDFFLYYIKTDNLV